MVPVYRSAFRTHPDAVTISESSIGKTVYITREAVSQYPSLQGRIKWPLQVKVVDIRKLTSAKRARAFRRDYETVYLESPETGTFGVSSWRLSGETYRSPDFATHVPFAKDEYVQIGSNYSDTLEVKDALNPEDTITFSDGAAPYLGKFQGVSADGKSYLVEVKSVPQDLTLLAEVPKEKVSALVSGSESVARERLRELNSTKLSFQSGETVRFRDAHGLMRVGKFKRTRSGVFEVQTIDRKRVFLSQADVFKSSGSDAMTPMYNAEWIQAEFTNPDGLVKEFLNGAAKLTSQTEFKRLTNTERITLLADYTKRQIPWTKGARAAEAAGLRTFNELLCAGAGVCRHNSTLLATTLSEAGYTTRLVGYQAPKATAGHAWLEVQMPLANGQLETFVVDPSSDELIIPFWKMMKMAKENKDSNAAKFYSQPDRFYLAPRDP